MNERLYRTVDDRVVAGVCGGLAVRLGVDPSLVRIAFAVTALLTGIFPLLVLYVIMAIVVPEEPTGFAGRAPSPPGPGAVPGWMPPGGSETRLRPLDPPSCRRPENRSTSSGDHCRGLTQRPRSPARPDTLMTMCSPACFTVRRCAPSIRTRSSSELT